VSAGRLLTARSPSSVNTPQVSPLNSSDTTAGKRSTSMPMASSVVSRLSTSRLTSASYTAFHPAHTSSTVAEARENPKPPSCHPATSSTFANSSSGISAHPSTVSRRARGAASRPDNLEAG
jgi:hypothetical protein